MPYTLVPAIRLQSGVGIFYTRRTKKEAENISDGKTLPCRCMKKRWGVRPDQNPTPGKFLSPEEGYVFLETHVANVILLNPNKDAVSKYTPPVQWLRAYRTQTQPPTHVARTQSPRIAGRAFGQQYPSDSRSCSRTWCGSESWRARRGRRREIVAPAP